MRKKVYICEDHPLYRQALEGLIADSAQLELLGSCGDGVSAIDAFAELAPSIVLLDLNLPKKDGFQVLEFIKEHCPQTLVVILTSYDDRLLAEKARKSGASAYLLKDTAGEELVTAVEELVENQFYTNVSAMQQSQLEGDKEFTSILKLTRTEKKLVKALIKGDSVSSISSQFYISENTVKNHKKNIYRKLEVKTQAELILLCQKHGLLD